MPAHCSHTSVRSPDRNETIVNAPRPWIIAHDASEIAAVCDAQGRRLLLCRNEIAQLIVEAVNKLEVEA